MRNAECGMRNGKHVILVLLIAFLLAACVLFTGCLRARSLDEFGYAMVVGVDRGEEKAFYVSMLIQRGGGDAPGQQEEHPLCAAECEDIFEAVELMESGLPYKLNLSRTVAIVCSDEVARTDGLEQFLSASLSALQIRYYTNLIVARGQAADFLNGMKSELMPNLEKLQYSYVDLSKTTGSVPSITLMQFYDRAYHDAGDAALPLGIVDESEDGGPAQSDGGTGQNASDIARKPANEAVQPIKDLLGEDTAGPGTEMRTGGLQSTLIGSAVFNGTKMMGTLNGEHTKMMLMAAGDFYEGRMQIPLGDGEAVHVLLSRKERPKVELEWTESPRAHFSLSFYAAVERGSAFSSSQNTMVEQAIAEYLNEKLTDVYYACRDVGADVFAVGKAAVTRFFDATAFEQFDWKEMFLHTDADFTVSVQMEYNPAHARLE